MGAQERKQSSICETSPADPQTRLRLQELVFFCSPLRQRRSLSKAVQLLSSPLLFSFFYPNKNTNPSQGLSKGQSDWFHNPCGPPQKLLSVFIRASAVVVGLGF